MSFIEFLESKNRNLSDIYEKGYNDAEFGSRSIDSKWSKEERIAWEKGYKDGKSKLRRNIYISQMLPKEDLT